MFLATTTIKKLSTSNLSISFTGWFLYQCRSLYRVLLYGLSQLFRYLKVNGIMSSPIILNAVNYFLTRKIVADQSQRLHMFNISLEELSSNPVSGQPLPLLNSNLMERKICFIFYFVKILLFFIFIGCGWLLNLLRFALFLSFE